MTRRRFLSGLTGAALALGGRDARAGAGIPAPSAAGGDGPIAAVRAATGAGFAGLWDEPRFELQVIYTRIDRRPGAAPQLTHFHHGVVAERWFAPASLVKLPVAALALERVLELAGRGVDRESPLVLRVPPRCAQSAALESESVARAIRRMFVVSENDPYNRLYELLGQDRIHARLADVGCPMSRVISRIAACSAVDNRTTGPSEFRAPDGRVIAINGPAAVARERAFPHGRALKGRAWVEGRKVTPGPHDFSASNFMPLEEAHRMLIAIVLPEALPGGQRFRLDADARAYLRQCMGMLPDECTDPVYDARSFPATYAKYLIGGGGMAALPAGVRSFNKVGRSYGYLADCAYISDAARGAEFFLSASLYVNQDDILNDGKYEYRETGWPMLAALGRAALEVDAARLRAHPAVPLGADGRFGPLA